MKEIGGHEDSRVGYAPRTFLAETAANSRIEKIAKRRCLVLVLRLAKRVRVKIIGNRKVAVLPDLMPFKFLPFRNIGMRKVKGMMSVQLLCALLTSPYGYN
ncbi:MAG: hypothetical protein KGZ69_08050 [Methylomonas sp.]|nr:hypothetical protein [Methylomonas sp.]